MVPAVPDFKLNPQRLLKIKVNPMKIKADGLHTDKYALKNALDLPFRKNSF